MINLSSVKKLRRDLCKTMGHDWLKNGDMWSQHCKRCKKRYFTKFEWSGSGDGCVGISPPEYIGQMPKRKDVEVIPLKGSDLNPLAGDLRWDEETQKIVMWDGKNWVKCG